MSQTDINSLPDEILIEIFGYLSRNLTKSCTLVCHRWNDIISNMREFWKNFRLNPVKEKMENYELKEFSRNYESANLNKFSLKFLDYINPRSLYSLELCGYKVEELAPLINVLNNLLNLKDLTIRGMLVKEFNDKKAVLKIEKLTLDVADTALKFLDVKTLKDFSTKGYHDNFIDVINFLEQQEQLQKLSLGDRASRYFFRHSEIFDLKFRLSSLILSAEEIYREDLLRFLSIHKETLKTLILGVMPGMHFGIYKFIWNNLNLTHIDAFLLKCDQFDDCIYENPEYVTQYTPKFPVESVKFIDGVYPEDVTSDYFRMLLTSMSSAKCLDFSDLKICYNVPFNYKTFKHICKVMNNLTVLHMPENFEQKILVAKSIYLPKLQELYMKKIKDATICKFIRRHLKTLMSVSFKWSNEDFMEQIIDELISYEKLKTVIIRVDYGKVLDAYKKLDSKKYKKWNLKLEEILCFGKSSKVSYTFPDDIAIWDADYANECQKKMST